MKILVMNIPLRPTLPLKLFPIGLGYVTTAMKNGGWEFELLDIDVLRLSDDQIHKHLTSKKYDVICMGCMVTGYKYIKHWTNVVKSYNPGCRIIVGNSVATSIPNLLLQNTKVDIAVMGEGDEVILELLDAISNNQPLHNILGIYFKDTNDNIVNTGFRPLIKNISALPYIDFDIFDADEYINASRHTLRDIDVGGVPRALPISTARGCISNCTFCYHVFKAKKYRYRTPESIADELKKITEKYNLNYVHFWDELTFFSKKQTDALAQAIIDSGVKVSWMARCRANLFDADEDVEIIKKMKEAGCQRVQYSLESADEEILKAMNKRITPEQFTKQTALFNKAGVQPITSLVLGYPQETPETIKKGIDCCIENGIYPSTGYLLPQPGSYMYTYAVEHGFIQDEEEYIMHMGDRQDLLVNLTKMSDEEFKSTVIREMQRCNEELNAGHESSSLIKTHSKE